MNLVISSTTGAINLRPVSDGCVATKRKIRGLTRIKSGWHYGEGVAFDDSEINLALQLLDDALKRGYIKSDVFPALNGAILLTFYEEEYCVEITVRKDSLFDFTLEFEDDELSTNENLTYSAVLDNLKSVRSLIWNSSELSTLVTTIRKGVVSEARPSVLVRPMGRFRSSISNVLKIQAQPSVDIFSSITAA